MRPQSGSIEEFSQEHKPMSFGTRAILMNIIAPFSLNKYQKVERCNTNISSQYAVPQEVIPDHGIVVINSCCVIKGRLGSRSSW